MKSKEDNNWANVLTALTVVAIIVSIICMTFLFYASIQADSIIRPIPSSINISLLTIVNNDNSSIILKDLAISWVAK